MKRSSIVTAHLVATAIAVITISTFFSFSLIAEFRGEDLFIKQVKTLILYCLPILLIAMPMLVLSGKKLAGNSKSPLIIRKMRRMKFIAINGVMLISLAIFLFYYSNYKTIDSTFMCFQILELLIGALNLVLIGMNIYDGLKLSGRLKRQHNF